MLLNPVLRNNCQGIIIVNQIQKKTDKATFANLDNK